MTTPTADDLSSVHDPQAASEHQHSGRREAAAVQGFQGIMEMGGASMQITFLPLLPLEHPNQAGSLLRLPGWCGMGLRGHDALKGAESEMNPYRCTPGWWADATPVLVLEQACCRYAIHPAGACSSRCSAAFPLCHIRGPEELQMTLCLMTVNLTETSVRSMTLPM